MQTIQRPGHHIQESEHSSGTTLFCWRFNHPRFGWCGGHSDDRWTPNRNEVESAMEHCDWPSELLEKVVS